MDLVEKDQSEEKEEDEVEKMQITNLKGFYYQVEWD